MDQLRGSAGRLTATPAIPVVLFVMLGLWRIGEKSFWLDEGVSVAIARLPTPDLLAHLWRVEMHAAPYYLALHPWLALGQSEATIRALSVLFGVVALVATWAIGRRESAVVCFAAALLLAVSPIFVQYAQDARGYTLLMAGSAASTLLFLRLTDLPGWRRAIPYALAAGGLIYVHPLGALVVAAHALAVPLTADRPRWRPLLLTFVPIGLLWLPMLRFMLNNRNRIDWVPPLTAEIAVDGLIALGGGMAAAAVLAVMLLLRARRDAITPWLLVPLVGTIAMSLLVQPVFQVRYLLGAVPAAMVIAGRNRAPLVGLLVLASLAGAWNWYEHGQKEDWRAAAAWVAAEVEPGDGIAFSPHYLRSPFGFYARVGEPLYPPQPWSAADLLRGPAAMDRVPATVRIWLVEGDHPPALPPELAAELGRRVVAEQRTFAGGVRVTLLVGGSATAP